MAIIAGGCVGPDAARDVAGAAQRTITAFRNSAGDWQNAGRLAGDALGGRRVMILGGLPGRCWRGYITADFRGGHGPGRRVWRMRRRRAIVDEVRLGRMTRAQAEAFIVDYSLSLG
ncbi:MAG: hypothetical protein R3B46_01645 [Phycisphaerales bacterium]